MEIKVEVKGPRGMIHVITHTLERQFQNVTQVDKPFDRSDPRNRPDPRESEATITVNDPAATIENVTEALRRFTDRGVVISIT